MGYSNIKLCWFIGHMKSKVLVNILCDLEPLDLGSGSKLIMYFLVNVSPPKGLDVETSNFVAR